MPGPKRGSLPSASAKTPVTQAEVAKKAKAATAGAVAMTKEAVSQRTKAAAAALNKLPAGWSAKEDPQSGKIYYQNEISKVTQWELPTADVVVNMCPAANTINLTMEMDVTAAVESATDAVNTKVDQLKEYYAKYTEGSSKPEYDRSGKNFCNEFAAFLCVWVVIILIFYMQFRVLLFCSEVTATNPDGSCRALGDCPAQAIGVLSGSLCPAYTYTPGKCEALCAKGTCHKGPLGRCDCDDGYCWVYYAKELSNPMQGWTCQPYSVANATRTTCGGLQEAISAQNSPAEFWVRSSKIHI